MLRSGTLALNMIMFFSDFRNYLQEVYDVSEGPSETDLNETIKGILRIQHVYNLKSRDVGTHVSKWNE